MTLRPDLNWLRDSARVFPVTLDPDFSWSNGVTTFNGASDTYLASGDQANSEFWAASYLQTGHYNRTFKSLLRFDVGAAIPTNAVVSAATFKAYAPPATPKALASHSLRTVTADWDANANWNRRKVGVSWTTLGGDVSSNSAYTSAATNVQTNPGWYSWTAPLATVQGWVAGSLPNYGFQLATNSGAPSGNSYAWASTEASTSSTFPADSTKRPILEVTWSVPDTTAPALSLSGALAGNQSSWRTAATGDITLSATDAGTGVKRLEILEGSTVIQSDTQTCPAGGCSQSHAFTLDLDALGEGAHTLTAAAIDGGNLRSEQTFTVRVDRQVPGLALTGTLVDDQALPAESGTRSVHVAATDAGAGIVDLKLAVDGAQQEHVTQACAAGGCSRTEDWAVDVGALGDGPHSVEIVATDGAGRTKSETLDVVKEAYPMPEAPPLSETSITPFPQQVDFLYDGPDAVQTGLDEEALEERRIAVVTGKVFNGEGVPAAGVTVSVSEHPEFGETVSRENGQFFLVVNGGAELRLRYEVQGALPAERTVETKWNDYTWAEDVWLVTADPVGTPVAFGTSTPDIQVAESSVVSDDDGERQTRVLVRPGTQAWKQMADGSTVPLTGGTMRMTEYTVGEDGPKRMPATLPADTAYTWAAEFQLDEAQGLGVEHVQFSKPVAAYVENFLDFPVGTDIPIGTYEPSAGAWAGEPDGRVIEILAETAGRAVVDVTSLGPATQEELDYFNFDDEELEELADAYEPGDTLWRTQLTRYSSVDWNHAFLFNPNWLFPPDFDPFADPDDCCEQSGSIIGVQNQSLGETADLGGTPYSLRYDSARAPGAIASRSVRVPLTGEDPDDDLTEVRVVVVVAGQRLIHTEKAPDHAPLAANLFHTFRWDGNDEFGRPMVGGANADIEIRNVYPAAYSPISRLGRARIAPAGLQWIESPYFAGGASVSWGRSGGGSTLVETVSVPPAAGTPPVDRDNLECDSTETNCWYDVPTPQELGESRSGTPVTRDYSVAIPYIDARSVGVGGWGVSVQHRYDTGTGTLYTGDGERRSADSLAPAISRVRDPAGNPNDPVDLQSVSSNSLAVLPDGSLLRSDPFAGHVVRDWPDGHTTVFAGNESAPAGSGDGGPATAAGLGWVLSVAVGPDGSAYLGDYGAKTVRKVDPNGTISTIAGNGTTTSGQQPTDPLQHAIEPEDIAVGGDGTVWIGDRFGLHRLAPAGDMERLAGPYGCAPSGECRFDSPPVWYVAAANDGTVYWSASYGGYSHTYYRYRPGDAEPKVLANASDSVESEEGPFAQSSIVPRDLAIDAAGRLLIAESESTTNRHGIWRLETNGRVRQIGFDNCDDFTDGTGTLFVGDGGPFRQACGRPEYMAQGPDGLYIAEPGGRVLTRVSSALQRYPTTETLIPSEDGSEVYRFDESGRHLATLDGRTQRQIRSFSYDGDGRLSSITETDLGTTTFAYGTSTVTVTGPDGQQTVIETNGDGWATKVQDAAGGHRDYAYTSTGLMTEYTDELGHGTEFTWGPTGRLLTDTSPEGGEQVLARNESGAQTTVTHESAGGQTTTYLTDELAEGRSRSTVTAADGSQNVSTDNSEAGVQTETELADGTEIEQSQDGDPRWGGAVKNSSTTVELPSGLTATSSHETEVQRSPGQDKLDPFDYDAIVDTLTLNGRTTTSTYDKAARTDTTQSPLGRTSESQYDEDDRPVRVSSPDREDVEIEYDSRGRPTTTTQGTAESQVTYGTDGRVATTTDAENRTTSYVRDDLGRPTAVTRPGALVTAFGYDAASQLTQITSPDSRTFNYEYDDNGNQTKLTRNARPGSGDAALVYQREYDDQDRLTSRTRPSGEEITTSYDSAGRLDEREAADGTRASSTYEPVTAGKGGRLASVQTGEGASTTFEYDGSLLTGVQSLGDTWTGDVTADQPEVTLDYDNSMRVTSETIDGDDVDVTYNDDDQPTQIGDVSITYDEESGDPETTSAGDSTTSFDIDTRGNLAASASTVEASGVTAPVFSESVVRDELGRITQRTETVGAGAPTTYGYEYDPAGRLTQVSRGGLTTETYGYDSSDGLVSRGNGVLSSWIDTDGHGRPVELADGTELQWSADGELLKTTAPGGAETEFAYDGFGRLVEVTLPDGRVGRYRYDALGRRGAVRLDGTMIRRFVYGGSEFPRARVDADGDVLERYVYAGQAHVPDLVVRRDGQRLRLISDALGSVRAVVDIDTGQVMQRLAYDAYGRTTQDTAPGTQPFGYKGSASDPLATGAGLVWMGVRAYLPSIGRFASVDSAGLAGGWNQHDALGGDPINRIDANGRFALPLIVIGAAAGYGLLFPESTVDDWTAVGHGVATGLDRLGDALWSGIYWCADRFGDDPDIDDPDADADGDDADSDVNPEGKKWDDSLQPWRGKTKTNGKTGKDRRYYEWDHTHKDWEVYDKRGKHIGSARPDTGEIYKPPVKGREIDL